MAGSDLSFIATQSLFQADSEFPEVDELFSQIPLPEEFPEQQPCLDEYADGNVEQPSSLNLLPEEQVTCTNRSTCSAATRFGPLVTVSEITAVQESGIPTNTKENTNWAVRVWHEWALYRKNVVSK